MAYNYEYPYTDPNRYNADWLINNVKQALAEWEKVRNEFADLNAYVREYFKNLNLQEEVNKKIDEMYNDGTIERIIAKYLNMPINVKSYGAKGDGVTDDTLAIRRAIEENSGLSGMPLSLYFPTGTYIVSDTLPIGGATTWIGDSSRVSVIKLADNTNKPIISCGDDEYQRYGITIENIGFDGNSETNLSLFPLLKLNYVNESAIKSCELRNVGGTGISMEGVGIANHLIDVRIRGNANKTVYGARGNGLELLSGVTDTYLSNIDIGWFPNGYGIVLSGNDNQLLDAVCPWQCKIGYYLYNVQGTKIANATLDWMDEDSIILHGCKNIEMDTLIIRNGSQSAKGTHHACIIRNDSTNVVINAMVAYNDMDTGIRIDDTSHDIFISGCNFKQMPNSVDVAYWTHFGSIYVDAMSALDNTFGQLHIIYDQTYLQPKLYSTRTFSLTIYGDVTAFLPIVEQSYIITNNSDFTLNIKTPYQDGQVSIGAWESKNVLVRANVAILL